MESRMTWVWGYIHWYYIKFVTVASFRNCHIVWREAPWVSEWVSKKTFFKKIRWESDWKSELINVANERTNSLTSLLTCVSSHSSWLLCVMLCFIWRAIIFPIKYTTCISLSFSEWNFNQRPLHFRQRKFRKITRHNWKENNALSTQMENTENYLLREAGDAYVKVSRSRKEINSFLP